MTDVFTIFKIALWLLSFGGLCAFFARTLRLPGGFAPLFSLSAVSVLLTFSGMLGALLPSAVFVYGAGFLCVLYELLRRVRLKTRFRIQNLYVLILVLAWLIYCFFRLKTYLPYENDDLSHWALVARELLRTNALPTENTKILIFSSYPVSSAVNIDYFCRFVGESEWLYAYAQAFYRLIAFLPLFGLIKKNRVFGYASFVLAFLFIARAGGYIVSLRVDPLLTAYGAGAFAGILLMKEKDSCLSFALIPVMMMLTLTKNSGIFFALTAALALGMKTSKGRFDVKSFLIGSGASALSLGVWLFHVSRTFPEGLSTKHAVSLSSYFENAAEKGLDSTVKIAKAFINALVSPLPSDLVIYAMFVLALAFMGLLIYTFKKQKLIKPLIGMLGFLATVYISYLIFLFTMYIVSMPEKEALAAASFTRYHRTVTLYMGACALAFVYKTACHEKIVLNRARRIWIFSALACLIAITHLTVSLDTRPGVILSAKQDRSDRRKEIIEQKEAFGIEDGKGYLIFCAPDESENENNTDSLYYLYKYEFSSTRIGLVYASGESGKYIFHTYDNKRSPSSLDEIFKEAEGMFEYLIFHEKEETFINAVSALPEPRGMQILYPK